MAALRFDPDIICVGEMRDREAYSAIEASSTDHTVVSTVHGGGGRFARRRIASLAYQNFEKQSLQQAALAFPVVVFAHKLEDNSRKVMDITECVVGDDGELIYRKLWQYRIYCNEYENGRFRVEGKFERVNPISDSLRLKLLFLLQLSRVTAILEDAILVVGVRVHAGSDLSFCPRAPSGGRPTQQARPCHVGRGAPVVALCPGGKTHNSNFTKKQKVQYIISGNKRQ